MISTFSANELFAISIRLVDMTAFPTFLAGVFGINFDYDLSLLCSQILDL
jgi:hypothetical protein